MMPRRAKYDRTQILDAALSLLVEGGPSGLSITGVAASLGAPSGPIYHRFPTRDHLAAALWARTVDDFQSGLIAVLQREPSRTSAVQAARYVFSWCRENLGQAQLLLQYRSSDLIAGDWPPELQKAVARADRLLNNELRKWARGNGVLLERTMFALVDLPYAGVRQSIREGRPPTKSREELVLEAVRTLIPA